MAVWRRWPSKNDQLAALVGGAGPQVPRLLISIQPPTIQSPVSKRGPQEGSFPCNNRVNLTSGRPVGKKRRRKERTETCTIVRSGDQTHCDRRPRLLYDRSDQNQRWKSGFESVLRV